MRGDVQIATSNFGIDLGAAALWCPGRSNSNRLDRQYRPSQAEPAGRNDTSGMVCSLKTGHLIVKKGHLERNVHQLIVLVIIA